MWHHHEACVEAKLSHEDAAAVRWMEKKMDQNALGGMNDCTTREGYFGNKLGNLGVKFSRPINKRVGL